MCKPPWDWLLFGGGAIFTIIFLAGYAVWTYEVFKKDTSDRSAETGAKDA